MSKTHGEISKQVNIEKDINTISGYAGVDKLNELKRKYKYITSNFNKVIHSSPASMHSFIKTKDLENYLNGLFEKFDSNSINISVVAEVSSGKSTFLNALIFGKKVLDAKMGETTAKVFKISYGENIDSDDLKAKISKINSNTKNEISKENFALEDININDYIVNLTSDNEKLKKGIVLYDTPGFGTLNEKVMSKLIKEAVNRSDAVILLLDISKGLKKDEAKFIKEALSYIKEDKRFIVLNKFDAAIDEDEDEDEIQEQINKVVLDTKNELTKMSTNIDRSVLDRQTYYLSAIKALSGKSKNRPESLDFSRFPIFEESFWHRIVEAKKETFEDNVKDLVREGSIVINETKSQVDNCNTIIAQTNSLVLNMEKVSKEIKEIVSKQSKIFDSMNRELNQKTNIVWDEAGLFEKKMKKLIDDVSQKALHSIPEEEVKKEDFEKAYKEAIEEINKNFIKNNTIFIERINSDIIEKEKKVNKIIDTLNREIKDEKFKELNLKEIPKVKKKEANGETKQLNASNNVNLSMEENKVKNNHLISTSNVSIQEDDTAVSAATGATIGGGAGAAIGSVVPVLGTAIGGAIGTALGGVIGGLFGGSGKREAELEARHEAQMQEMRRENEKIIAEMKYKAAVEQAKRDFLYELKESSSNHINNYIAEKRSSIDNNYRTMLGEITSATFNAQNILRDMQTIIEDPSEQKRVIEENKEKINELNIFIKEIVNCFK